MSDNFLDQWSHRLWIFYLIVWTGLNGLSLTIFPAVHSDEAWLAGLAKAYLDQGRVTVTEPFFDLFPRQPHAFKVLFHFLQAALIRIFGFDLFAVRLLSLACAALTLSLIYLGVLRLSKRRGLALGLAIALSLQPLFLTSAHLARQESLILAVLAIAYARLPRIRRLWQSVGFGVILGGAALIHPNALFPAVIAGMILFKDTVSRQVSLKTLLGFGAGLAGAGVGLLGLSLFLSPRFLQNYAKFGANLSVDATPSLRGGNFGQFLRQLWQQDNGTYWLPDLRGLLVLAPVLALLALVLVLPGRVLPGRVLPGQKLSGGVLRAVVAVMGFPSISPVARGLLENGLLGLLGFFLVLYSIGRFNPTSIVFALVPLVYLLSGLVVVLSERKRWPGSVATSLLSILLVMAGVLAIPGDFGPMISQVVATGVRPYEAYNSEIRQHLPDDAVVLGNLSAGFILQQTAKDFYDIRNLAYAVDDAGWTGSGLSGSGPADSQSPAGLGVGTYLSQREINTVIWYEEYDFILRNPQWWVLYEIRPGRTANPAALRELKAILDQRGELIHTFTAPIYGTRAVRYQGDYPWAVSLYRLDPAANGEMPRIR